MSDILEDVLLSIARRSSSIFRYPMETSMLFSEVPFYVVNMHPYSHVKVKTEDIVRSLLALQLSKRTEGSSKLAVIVWSGSVVLFFEA